MFYSPKAVLFFRTILIFAVYCVRRLSANNKNARKNMKAHTKQNRFAFPWLFISLVFFFFFCFFSSKNGFVAWWCSVAIDFTVTAIAIVELKVVCSALNFMNFEVWQMFRILLVRISC